MAGRITETIERLIALYRPDSLIVGSGGSRGTLKTWGAVFGAPGMGSVSRSAGYIFVFLHLRNDDFL